MDNLTHSLVGALIGQMGLKRKTGLAMPTLIVAANIPDIDAVATLLGGHQHLAIRRGITHGPIAMVVLPLLLWAIMLWFDRWQTKRGSRPDKRLPIHKGWLLVLAYIGCLSHPLFDWFNSYGIRLLEPFSSQWFYGDTIFIIDVWLYMMLAAGLWFCMRKERAGVCHPTRPAWIAALGIVSYISVNFGISSAAVSRFKEIQTIETSPAGPSGMPSKVVVVANPVPLAFWKRDVLWRAYFRNEEYSGEMEYDFFAPMARGRYQTPVGEDELLPRTNGWPTQMSDPRISAWAAQNPDAEAFLFWSRLPVAEEQETSIILRDQRFTNPLVNDRFSVTLEAPN